MPLVRPIFRIIIFRVGDPSAQGFLALGFLGGLSRQLLLATVPGY
jgi:hypothetical protein